VRERSTRVIAPREQAARVLRESRVPVPRSLFATSRAPVLAEPLAPPWQFPQRDPWAVFSRPLRESRGRLLRLKTKPQPAAGQGTRLQASRIRSSENWSDSLSTRDSRNLPAISFNSGVAAPDPIGKERANADQQLTLLEPLARSHPSQSSVSWNRSLLEGSQ
jgi:hypothetical protein